MRKKGTSPSQVASQLIDRGYDEPEVEAALRRYSFLRIKRYVFYAVGVLIVLAVIAGLYFIFRPPSPYEAQPFAYTGDGNAYPLAHRLLLQSLEQVSLSSCIDSTDQLPEIERQLAKEQCSYYHALLQRDAALCSGVSSVMRAYCVNTVAWLAMDPSLCTGPQAENCTTAVTARQVLVSAYPSHCASSSCFSAYAALNGNASICVEQEVCPIVAMRDAAACSTLEIPQKDACLGAISLLEHDIGLCEGTSQPESCALRVILTHNYLEDCGTLPTQSVACNDALRGNDPLYRAREIVGLKETPAELLYAIMD